MNDSTELMQSLGSNPDDILARIELMERLEDLQSKKLKREGDLASLVPKINKQVEDLIKLKTEVDKDRLQVDSDDNKDAVGHFIIDEFIEKHT